MDGAPRAQQRGKIGAVIDYCLQDVDLTRRLVELGYVIDPNDGNMLVLPPPFKQGSLIIEQTVERISNLLVEMP